MVEAVGIDVGGSKTVVALVNTHGQILKSMKFPTPHNKEKFLKKVVNAIEDVSYGREISGIGAGIAGPVDRDNGIVLEVPNIKGWKNVKLKAVLQKHFKVPIYIDNDLNAMALAENYFGAGRNSKSLILISLSSGVGGGIMIDRQPYYSSDGIAGEIGHVTLDERGPKCGCGKRGCIETFLNRKAIMRRAKKYKLRGKTPLDIYNLAIKGNKKAKKVFDETAHYLGIALANIVNIFNPDTIVLVGGIANADIMYPKAKREMKKRTFSKAGKNVRVVHTKLTDDVGAIGAASLVFKTFGDKSEAYILRKIKRPFITVDCIIKYYKNRKFQGIVIVERKNPPFGWALPGGFMNYNETMEEAVAREIKEETSLKVKNLMQFHTYSAPGRDPRMHTTATVFIAEASGRLKSGDDAKDVAIIHPKKMIRLVFDHNKIIRDALKAGII